MRPRVVTDTDIALLRSLARLPSVVAASRNVGISRDRAVYRIAQLERAFGGAIVSSERGGTTHGGTRLTPLGDRIVRRGFDSVELLDARPVSPPLPSNRIRGTYHGAPTPQIILGRDVRLRVAFKAEEGEPVTVMVDPESILVAGDRFPSSARNVIPAIVQKVVRGATPSASTLLALAGSTRIRVAVTEESVRELRLAPGAPLWLYVKATALRRVGPPSPDRHHAGLRRRTR
jgi:molybdate transport system regulatory protein